VDPYSWRTPATWQLRLWWPARHATRLHNSNVVTLPFNRYRADTTRCLQEHCQRILLATQVTTTRWEIFCTLNEWEYSVVFDGFLFLFIPVVLLGFLSSGASNHNGRHWQKLRTLKQTHLLISFHFICLCHLERDEHRSNHFRLKIYSATPFEARGGRTTRTPQTASPVRPIYNRLVLIMRKYFQVLLKRPSRSASCLW
jgi:hypothetical protein